MIPVLKLLEKPLEKFRATLGQIRENEKDPEKMKFKEYVAYLLGNLCYYMIGKMGSDYLLPYYSALGFSGTKAGAMRSACLLFDAVNDPVVATVIDQRKHTPNGRFKPYLAKMVPVLALFSVFMFTTPNFSGPSAVVAWCIMTFAIWETLNTFSGIAFQAIGTVMSLDPDERARYSTVGKIGFELAGLIPSFIPLLFNPITRPRGEGGLGLTQANFYTICAILFAVMGGAAGMFTKNLKERLVPAKKQEHFWENFVTFFKNKEFILLWSTNLPQIISSAGAVTTIQFYIHSLGNYSWQSLQWNIAGIPNFLAIFLAPYVLKRFRPSRVMLFSNLLNGLCFLVMFFVVKPIGYASPWGIAMIMFFTTLAWVPGGITEVARNILQMNTFDYTQAKTGKRAEATSLMMVGMLSKFIGAAAGLLGGMLLDYIGFIPGDTVAQTPYVKDGLFFIFALFPAVGALLSSIPLFFYKLEGKEYERRMAELAQRNEAIAVMEMEMAQR